MAGIAWPPRGSSTRLGWPFTNRWLNIPVWALTTPLGGEGMDVPGEDAGVRAILDSHRFAAKRRMSQVLEYLNAGYSADQLLDEMGRTMLWDDTNTRSCPPGTAFEEGSAVAGPDPPPRTSRPVTALAGLARYATDIRINKDSGSATNTALRFAGRQDDG